MNHTPTPWERDLSTRADIKSVNGRRIASTWGVTLNNGENSTLESRANADRIIACVNACEGIPTDKLLEFAKKLKGQLS